MPIIATQTPRSGRAALLCVEKGQCFDLGEELPKRKLRGNQHFRFCSSSVLVPVVKSHNDSDGGLVTP